MKCNIYKIIKYTLKKSGIHIGRTTASSNNRFASCKSAISSQ